MSKEECRVALRSEKYQEEMRLRTILVPADRDVLESHEKRVRGEIARADQIINSCGLQDILFNLILDEWGKGAKLERECFCQEKLNPGFPGSDFMKKIDKYPIIRRIARFFNLSLDDYLKQQFGGCSLTCQIVWPRIVESGLAVVNRRFSMEVWMTGMGTHTLHVLPHYDPLHVGRKYDTSAVIPVSPSLSGTELARMTEALVALCVKDRFNRLCDPAWPYSETKKRQDAVAIGWLERQGPGVQLPKELFYLQEMAFGDS